jgi:uncharacterized protein (DUF924 family)
MKHTEITSHDVLHFWFIETPPRMWWKKDLFFDAQIKERFGALHDRAVKGELADWRATPEGSLAEIILLDQFSRNMYRDSAKAFEADELALKCARVAIGKGFDAKLTTQQKGFLYSPFMHSESKEVHKEAMKLYKKDSMLVSARSFEKKHKDIIDRFGRYPHRNAVLGRTSTPEEIEFLKEPGSSF